MPTVKEHHSRKYKGQHYFGGDRFGKLAKAIINYKRYGKSLKYLQGIVKKDLDKLKGFDYVVPVRTAGSEKNLPKKLAKYIADQTGAKYADALSKNKERMKKGYDGKLKGCKVILVDDVENSGRTKRKALNSIRVSHPGMIQWYVIAKATRQKKGGPLASR